MGPETPTDAEARLVLRPARRQWVFVLVAASAFTATGVWMIASGREHGGLVGGFFGLATLVAAIQLVPSASYLALERDRFVVVHLFRRREFAWSAVGPFTVFAIGSRVFVVFDRLDPGPLSRVARMSAAVAARNDALPDAYGRDPEELAALMNTAREQVVARVEPRFPRTGAFGSRGEGSRYRELRHGSPPARPPVPRARARRLCGAACIVDGHSARAGGRESAVGR